MMYGEPLTDNDVESLAASFITRQVAEHAELRRVSDDEGADLVGRRRSAERSYAGVIFPYFLPGKDSPREYRLRRDQPDLERTADGTIKEKGKYMSPPGRGNMLYFPRSITENELRDTAMPIVFVEGEKKTLALSRAATLASRKFVPIGLSGVWNFRGVVGKTQNFGGARRNVKGVLSDFDLIELANRKVFVLFDTNVRTNESVAAARTQFAKVLSARGAEVFLADMPGDYTGNGVDDLLGETERDVDEAYAVLRLVSILDNAKDFILPKQKQADRLAALASDAEYFHDADGRAFASIVIGGHLETYGLHSKAFREYLAREFYRAESSAPSTQSIQDAINALSGRACFDGVRRDVYVRAAGHGGNVYVDLGNDAWEQVEVTATGSRVIGAAASPVRFRRPDTLRTLCTPQSGGNLSDIRKYVRVKDDDAALLLQAFIVGCFAPNIPYPILAFSGPPGSAKSTAARLVKDLIDPASMPHRSCPRKEEDLLIAAQNSYLVSFDNVSTLSDAMSDAHCRLSTGGGIGRRTLHADSDETTFTARRPQIFNGIGGYAMRTDFVNRLISIELDAIPPAERKTEREVLAGFEKAKPRLLGAVFDAVSMALRNLELTRVEELPRMADFAIWAVAAEGSFGCSSGAFLKAFEKSHEREQAGVLDDSLVAEVFLELNAEKDGRFPDEPIFTADLLAELTAKAGDQRSRRRDWPKNAQKLRHDLSRLSPALEAHNISVRFPEKRGRKSVVRITSALRRKTSEAYESVQGVQSMYTRDVWPNTLNGEASVGVPAHRGDTAVDGGSSTGIRKSNTTVHTSHTSEGVLPTGNIPR